MVMSGREREVGGGGVMKLNIEMINNCNSQEETQFAEEKEIRVKQSNMIVLVPVSGAPKYLRLLSAEATLLALAPFLLNYASAFVPAFVTSFFFFFSSFSSFCE